MMLAATLLVMGAQALVPTHVDVAIAGGGLGGLAACAAMRARGIDAHFFEAADELLRGSTGTGIMISANGMNALGAIDTRLVAMRARGVRITSQKITKYAADGKEEKRASMDATTFKANFGHDQYNIAWSSAHEVLAGVVPAEAVHCGRAVAGAKRLPGDIGVDVAFVDGSSVRCKLLVGADGIGSKVRSLVATGDDAPRYSDQLLWNAIVDSDKLPLHGPGEVSFATTGVDGRAILAFDAGEGKTSWYLTLPSTECSRATAAAVADGSFGGFDRAEKTVDLEASFAAFPDAL
jgi:2-polyprenyl-6-methoxyphenol hydroxylase-like FAD-dependent oxidoreductase